MWEIALQLEVALVVARARKEYLQSLELLPERERNEALVRLKQKDEEDAKHSREIEIARASAPRVQVTVVNRVCEERRGWWF